MNAKATQQAQMAGKTKLTAISLYHGASAIRIFAELLHDERGRAIMPHALIDKCLTDINYHRGDTLTVG